jgi:AsmA protein
MSVSLRIREFRVQNGMITSRLPARTNVLGIRSLSLQHQTDGGPLELAATFVYSDYRPFTLTASAQPKGKLTDPWNAQLEFAAFDATAFAKGIVEVSGDYDLQLDASTPALERLNALLPDLRLPALHQATLSTHLTNGPVHGDLPVIGTTQLHIGSADLGNIVPGLKLGVIDVALPDAGGLATVKGIGSYADQAFSVKGTFGVPEHPDGNVSLPIDLTAQTQAVAKTATSGNLSLKGNLTLNTGSFAGLDAAVELRTPALADMHPFAFRTLPALTALSLSGKLAIPATANTLIVTGAKLTSHEGDLAGDVTVGVRKTVALTGKLRSTKLDVDGLLKASGIGQQAGGEPARSSSGPLIPNTPLPWETLRGASIELSVDVDTVTFERQPLHDLSMAMTLKDSRLNVGRLTLAMPGGSLEASLMVDASRDAAPVKMTLHAPAIPLSLISHYAGLPDEPRGALRVDTQLQSAGRTPHEIAASLNGPLNATILGGKMSNAALITLASASLQALGIKVPAQGETDIHCFGLIGVFNNGVGRFGTIAVSSTYLEVAGSGQFDLNAETAAFKLHPMAQITGSPVSVPVVVDGPLRSLQGRLDASGLDRVGLFIDGLFGGDKPATCSDAGLVAPQPAAP